MTCHPEQSEGSPDQLYKMCIKSNLFLRGGVGGRVKNIKCKGRVREGFVFFLGEGDWFLKGYMAAVKTSSSYH